MSVGAACAVFCFLPPTEMSGMGTRLLLCGRPHVNRDLGQVCYCLFRGNADIFISACGFCCAVPVHACAISEQTSGNLWCIRKRLLF